ncbi:hypothetical protein K469DRAFT_763487 [Zopfia rhizophila CBS 207.26]|uniref:Uncharacterized protein n=1 Tax=Zopfia rhizophila CBS 207.26 TaxID=1314779 RepID=A0A6A6DC41_9PEZI|nr:hypothetical protein K469DRAFT_763487 [Zopfia rhizophila CBS 207.26]
MTYGTPVAVLDALELDELEVELDTEVEAEFDTEFNAELDAIDDTKLDAADDTKLDAADDTKLDAEDAELNGEDTLELTVGGELVTITTLGDGLGGSAVDFGGSAADLGNAGDDSCESGALVDFGGSGALEVFAAMARVGQQESR